jgi:hypothetical protein
MRSVLFALSVAAVACSYPTKLFDPTGGLQCSGKPNPTTAPPMVTITGTTIDEVVLSAVGSAMVEGFFDGVSASVFEAISDANGNFTGSLPTGGVARNGYLVASAPGYLATNLTFGVPISAGLSGLQVPMFTQSDLAMLGSAAMQSFDGSNVQGVIAVSDCLGSGIVGATVTTDPPASAIVYANQNLPDLSLSTTDATGIAFVFNLPPGTISIGGLLEGTPLRTHTATVMPGQVMVSLLQP